MPQPRLLPRYPLGPARGGGRDWMSRFAECERDEEHEEEEEEFPALKVPNKSEVTRYLMIINDIFSRKLQNMFLLVNVKRRFQILKYFISASIWMFEVC